jgi:hypothetical protein
MALLAGCHGRQTKIHSHMPTAHHIMLQGVQPESSQMRRHGARMCARDGGGWGGGRERQRPPQRCTQPTQPTHLCKYRRFSLGSFENAVPMEEMLLKDRSSHMMFPGDRTMRSRVAYRGATLSRVLLFSFTQLTSRRPPEEAAPAPAPAPPPADALAPPAPLPSDAATPAAAAGTSA